MEDNFLSRIDIKKFVFKLLELCLYALPITYVIGDHISNPLLLIWIPIIYLLFHLLDKSLPFDAILRERGLFLLCLLWVTSIFSIGLPSAWHHSRDFLSGLLVLSATIEVICRDRKALNIFVVVLSLLGVYLGIDSIYQWFFKIDLFGVKLCGCRAMANLWHPNFLGFVLSASLPSSLYLMYKLKSRYHIYLVFIAALLAFCGIVLSGSRSAWIATLVILFITTPLLLREQNRIFQLVFLGLGGICAVLLAGRVIIRRISSTIHHQNPRIALWKKSLHIIGQFPALGTGIDNWKIHSIWAKVTFPHNFFLEIATECGVPLLLLFCYCIYRIVRVYFIPLWRHVEGRFYLCITIGPFIAAIIDIPFFSRHVSTFFWTCLGITIGAFRNLYEDR